MSSVKESILRGALDALDYAQNEIVKVCAKHGKLTRAQVNKNKIKDTPSYRCKLCQKESHAKHWQRHAETVKEKQKKYRETNPQRVKEIKRRSRIKNAFKYRETRSKSALLYYRINYLAKRQRENLRRKKNRILLSDGYVKRLMTRRSPLSCKDVPLPLIGLLREAIKLKRKLKKIDYNEELKEILQKLGEQNGEKNK